MATRTHNGGKGTALFVLCIGLFLAPLLGLVGVVTSRTRITPNSEFFSTVIDGTPSIDITRWRLSVSGSVSAPLNLTYEDVTSLPSIDVTATLKCVEGPSGTAEWHGIPVQIILSQALLTPSAQDVVFFAADGYSSSLTVAECREAGVILAYRMNDETLPANQGYPLILVAPNHDGYKWVKWIYHIELVDYDYLGYWESRGWADDARYVPAADWLIHAVLFSISFLVGGLALVSGFKFGPNHDTFKLLPRFVTRRFHTVSSVLFCAIATITFGYWISATLLLRGAIFYTIHGIASLISMIAMTGSAITGIQSRRHPGTGTSHENWSQATLLAFVFVIFLGFVLGT